VTAIFSWPASYSAVLLYQLLFSYDIHSFIRWFIRLFHSIHSFIHSFHSFHSFIHWWWYRYIDSIFNVFSNIQYSMIFSIVSIQYSVFKCQYWLFSIIQCQCNIVSNIQSIHYSIQYYSILFIQWYDIRWYSIHSIIRWWYSFIIHYSMTIITPFHSDDSIHSILMILHSIIHSIPVRWWYSTDTFPIINLFNIQ